MKAKNRVVFASIISLAFILAITFGGARLGKAQGPDKGQQLTPQPSPPKFTPTPPTPLLELKRELENRTLQGFSSAPPNDDFDSATLITTLPFTETLDTTGATVAFDDPDMGCGGGVNSNTVWYRLAVSVGSRVEVNTFGSDYDTVLAVFTGVRGALNRVTCNDDTSGLQSRVIFDAIPGNVYYVEVADYGDPGGGLLHLSVQRVQSLSIFNQYIRVNTASDGLFVIGTTGGDPNTLTDDNKRLLYGYPGNIWSSFTTLRIQRGDGSTVDYPLGKDLAPISGPSSDGNTLTTIWEAEGIRVEQRLSFITTESGYADSVSIEYRLTNLNSEPREVGLRLLLDTMIGDNDGAPFFVPTAGNVTNQMEFHGTNMPEYWMAWESPVFAPDSVKGRGQLTGREATPPDRFVIADWPQAFNTVWDYIVDPNDAITNDSAVLIYFYPRTVQPSGSFTVRTYYGLGAPGATRSPTTLSSDQVELPADGNTYATLTLSLRNGVGNPLPNHRVRLISSRGSVDTFSPASGTTDAGGRFVATVRSSTPGTAVITAEDLTTGQAIPASVSITFTSVGGEPPPPPANEGAITITGVRSELPLDGRYLEGVSAPNRIEVNIDWKGTTPGSVDFIVNGQTHTVPASSWGAAYTLNMGQELQAGTNRLQILARNAEGATSTTIEAAPYLLSKPLWLAGLQSLGAVADFVLTGPVTGGREYVSTVRIPPQPIRLGAPGFGPPGSKTELQFYVGGGSKLQLRCDAPLIIEALAGAEANLDLMGVDLGGELKGSGSITAGAMQCEIPTAQGTIRLDVKVYGQKDWPVLTFVVNFISPGAGTALEQTLRSVGLYDLMRMLGEIYLQANLNGFFESGAHTVLESPYLEWEGAHLGGGPGLEAGYRYKQAVFEFKVLLGGKGTAEFVNPNPLRDLTDLHFDRVIVHGEAGYKVRAGWFGDEKRYFVEWAFPSQGQTFVTQARPLQVKPSQWRLLGHGYRNKPYAAFHKPPPGKLTPFSPQALGITPEGLAVTTASGVLVSNVYTYTEPSLALNPVNDNALLLWVHDDVNKALGQNFDLAYSHWNGSAWSAPARVTDDTYLDGAPQVAWDGTGKGLAVWERLNDPALPVTATLDTTTTQKIEIAWAQYDPGTDSWSAPAWLTSNTLLDHKPVLARNAAGGLMAAWRQNGAGLLSGDAANPDRVMFATWDGSGWSTLAVAVDNIPGLVDLAAGYGDGAATIAYTRFLTPTGGITPTLQLFTATWDGSAWSAPQQLTDDDLGHTNPQVVYNTLNQPLLVWQAGETLRLRNLTTGAEADLTLDPDLVVDEFRLLHDAADNLAAVFTGQKAGQRDLFVAFYDAAHNAWGRPYRLTDDVHSEGYPAPALDSAGRLLMAYAQTQITSEERTTTDPQTGETITYTLPVEGQTDLYTLSHQFVQDLAMGALTVSDTHPQPGAGVTVSATVTNTGALALDGVQVAFYEGDPDAGGILLGTVTLPGTLAAGYTATLTTTYTVPTTGGRQQLVALADPQDQIVEADETNNRATLFAFGPDLELAGASVEYWSGSQVGLTALIRNIGTTASPTTTIAYHWEAITGTVAVTDTVPPLAAGQAITLTTPWDYGALAQGSYPLAAVVNAGETDFAEAFTANNEALLTLEVLPDLAVSPLYLWTEALPDARVIITATVYNFGSVAAPPAEAAFYVNQALTDTARIGVVPVPALEPGGQAVITATWDSPEWGERAFYVAVDPGRTLTETTWTNNLAGVSGASACTLLEGDVNCSCAVDVTDLQTVAALWRQTAELPYDLDGDERITVVDIMRVAAAWGDTCP